MSASNKIIINDITQLNPVTVVHIITPTSVEELQTILQTTTGPISVGGGHYSMGGQTSSPGSLHLDLRQLNKILDLNPTQKIIRVQSGCRWRDIQHHINPHGLSVKIMQTYANFTVGGSLSVNVHGRYIGMGPLILSVRRIWLLTANGKVHETSPTLNPELFYGAIGGYNGIGIITEAELDLAPNTLVERTDAVLPTNKYLDFFKTNVRKAPDAIFHNADMYPPHYNRLRAITWRTTEKPHIHKTDFVPEDRNYPLERYFFWMFSMPFGKWRREHIIEPIFFLKGRVHWRNYEASYDVKELEPRSRKHSTYVLQEYFIPYERLMEFIPAMRDILNKHKVNVINVSIRHALQDPGSLMAWARQEVFAFVLYHKQGTSPLARHAVGIWTRELIDAAIAAGGSYYLPYQPHATPAQFHKAYPDAHKLFALKKKLDPDFRFRNSIWNIYYAPTLAPINKEKPTMPTSRSLFQDVYQSPEWADRLVRFLANVYGLYPAAPFDHLMQSITAEQPGKNADETIYRTTQQKLGTIKPFLSELTYAIPSLIKQKKEMAHQTLQLLGTKKAINGYLEIGAPGRYLSHLRKQLQITGPVYIMDEKEPGYGPADILERAQITKNGPFLSLTDYHPITAAQIPDASLDLVTCFIGLHHCPTDKLAAFVASIKRILRPGGALVFRDHDVTSPDMATYVSLVHTVFNLGLKVSWEDNAREVHIFKSVAEWADYFTKAGFTEVGPRLLQPGDPSDNTLMAFIRK